MEMERPSASYMVDVSSPPSAMGYGDEMLIGLAIRCSPRTLVSTLPRIPSPCDIFISR